MRLLKEVCFRVKGKKKRLRFLPGWDVIRTGCRRIGLFGRLHSKQETVSKTPPPPHHDHHQTPELFIVGVMGGIMWNSSL